MTKAEIIRKLAKRVGVQDLDAKIFFEVFLRKVSQQLNPGETIGIKNFGYFQMRTGKIKNTSVGISKPVLADLIVFYPPNELQDDSIGNYIFNIPGKNEDEYNVIDSYFSLSFGKPVIPLKDANISEYFIPPTGNELRRLFDSKADKLLREVEVVEKFNKGNDLFIIDRELIDPDQMEINWHESNTDSYSHEKIIGDSDQAATKKPEVYSWEFGEDLDKEIEEEALLDTENENNLIGDHNDLKDISWDFGDNLSVSDEPKVSPEQDEIKNVMDKFQRVKSVISDYNILHLNPEPGDQLLSEDSELIKSINEELNEEGFAEVKHHPRNYDIDSGIFEKSDENNTAPEYDGDKYNDDVEQQVNSETEVEEDMSSELENGNNRELYFQTTPHNIDHTRPYSKSKGLGLYVVFAILIVLGAAAFIYIKFINPYYSENKPVPDAETSSYIAPPVIIERDYSIPVTYPYPKDSNLVVPFDPIDKSVYEKNENKKNNDSVGTDLQNKNNTKAPAEQLAQTKPVDNITSSAVRVKEFIYKFGNKYQVQISSWQSEQRALKHASYFIKKGYQTEIVKANLNNGTWYRVRVINFNTESEAQSFYDKYN
jgi:hypothetical protein